MYVSISISLENSPALETNSITYVVYDLYSCTDNRHPRTDRQVCQCTDEYNIGSFNIFLMLLSTLYTFFLEGRGVGKKHCLYDCATSLLIA